MTRLSLALHAATHLPGGQDPLDIPSGGIQWAYIDSTESSVSCPSSTSTRIPADATTFYTNAPSLFDAHNSGGGVMGMRLLADGHYLFWMSAIPSGTAPTAGDAFQLIPEGGGTFLDFNFAPFAMVFPSGGVESDAQLITGGIMCVGGFITPPTDAIVCRIDNLSAHNLHFEYTGLIVIQLDAVNQDL